MSDPVTRYVYGSTEEGKKVERNKGQKYLAFYRRIRLDDERNDVDFE